MKDETDVLISIVHQYTSVNRQGRPFIAEPYREELREELREEMETYISKIVTEAKK